MAIQSSGWSTLLISSIGADRGSDFNQHAFASSAVEFAVENLFPRPALCFLSFEIDPDQFGHRFICHGITSFLEWYQDGLTDASSGNSSAILP